MDGIRPVTLDLRSTELGDLVRRSREVVLLAAITGAVTGVIVRLFEYVAAEVVLHWVLDAPLWVGAIAPGIGLVLSAILLHILRNRFQHQIIGS